jgi:3-methyl-2-oxobutanoate hydroxymethyltransferase
MDRMTLPKIQQMKREGRKSVCVVAWDYQMAVIADRAGVDIISVGDTVGLNLWGHSNPLEITMEELLTVAKAVRRGTSRALVSCDFPFGPLQEGPEAAVRAAIRLVKEAGVDVVKLDGASDYPEAVAAVAKAGIPVFAQFGITPQTALHYGVDYAAMAAGDAGIPDEMLEELVRQARMLEDAGASLLNFTNSGPRIGPAVVDAVSIPVLGGMGGGPWLDGRIRMITAAIGYPASSIDDEKDTYANVARITLQALEQYAQDVRAGEQIRSGTPRPTA